jgi:hypothetical protein
LLSVDRKHKKSNSQKRKGVYKIRKGLFMQNKEDPPKKQEGEIIIREEEKNGSFVRYDTGNSR